jgi:hypothetical protein
MSEDFNYYNGGGLEETPGREHEDFRFDLLNVDPREWIPIPNNETEEEKRNRFRMQVHNTVIRSYTYPFEPLIDDKQVPRRELNNKNQKINDFNQNNIYMTVRYFAYDYPTREEIDNYLIQNGLPTSISNLPFYEQVAYRLRYPYAWFTKDVPLDWLSNNDRRFRADRLLTTGSWDHFDLQDINIRELNLSLRNKWTRKYDAAYEMYVMYMNIFNNSPPLPNPIVLFRGMSTDRPVIGSNITEYGFSSKSYFYSVSHKYSGTCCILAILYPPNHKFILPLGGKRGFGEFMSYPGEILTVDNITDTEDGKTIIYCHFIGYAPHMSPDGVMITPEANDDFSYYNTQPLLNNTPIIKNQQSPSKINLPTGPKLLSLNTSAIPTVPIINNSTVSIVPNIYKPTTPTMNKPIFPITNQPISIINKPIIPVTNRPISIINNPTIPVINKPMTPTISVVNKPTIPVVNKPTIPVVNKPTIPVVNKPTIPVINKPTIPVINKPTIPIAKPLSPNRSIRMDSIIPMPRSNYNNYVVPSSSNYNYYNMPNSSNYNNINNVSLFPTTRGL